MTKVLAADEKNFRDITWRLKQTRLYLRTSKVIRIPDRTKLRTRAKEIFEKLELLAGMAGGAWPDPAKKALAEVKRNMNSENERPRQQSAQPKTIPNKQEDGGKRRWTTSTRPAS